jgi:hypothetical protein
MDDLIKQSEFVYKLFINGVMMNYATFQISIRANRQGIYLREVRCSGDLDPDTLKDVTTEAIREVSEYATSRKFQGGYKLSFQRMKFFNSNRLRVDMTVNADVAEVLNNTDHEEIKGLGWESCVDYSSNKE